MKNRLSLFFLSILIVVVAKFWIGIYEHDEFSENYLFIKHRPIWQTYFYSPRGMSDLKLSDMSEIKRKDQILFDEFVLENLKNP